MFSSTFDLYIVAIVRCLSRLNAPQWLHWWNVDTLLAGVQCPKDGVLVPLVGFAHSSLYAAGYSTYFILDQGGVLISGVWTYECLVNYISDHSLI